MKKQAGNAMLGLVSIVIILLGVGGWVANIVKLIGMIGGEITTMFVARAVGVFAAPFGAVLGFF